MNKKRGVVTNKKKRAVVIEGVIVLLFLVIAIIFKISISPNNLSLTGFTIYESPSDSSTINDTYIRSGATADTNYGSSTALWMGNVSSGIEYRSLIKFNLSSITAGVTITNAKLQVYQESSYGSSNITIKAYRLTLDWNELEASWNNKTSLSQWSALGGDYGEEIDSLSFSNSSGNYYNFSVTQVVRGWLNSSYENYGLILIANNANQGNYTRISSSNSLTASQIPKIIIDYTTNAPPSITGISTDSSLSNPKKIGEQLTFTVNWTDYEGNQAQMFVCNSSNISASGCAGSTFCNSSTGNSPSSCQYTILASNNRTTNFYIAVCDSNCSEINQSSFYMNHAPYALVTSPNGGETINQSQGNYKITFNVSDNDPDNLFANIYYGAAQNSTTTLIFSNLNLTQNCTDKDSNLSTPNNCSYYWNSTGIYGDYYLTIIINDSYSTSNDSSNSIFGVRSLIDTTPPEITAQWTESDIYSGKTINFYANISEENINTIWVSINATSQVNYTMNSLISGTYNVSWIAISPGNYQFKVYANDTIGNLNNSISWSSFTIRAPNATTQNQLAPSIALPYHTIKITGQLNVTDSIKNVYAYLNVPEGFTFLSNYSQNTFLGNFTENQTKTSTWFVSVPLTEANYTLNITYSDSYSNSWLSSNFYVSVTSDISGGYSLSISGYPEVETGQNYYAEASFKKSGIATASDSIKITLYNSAGTKIVDSVSMTEKETGVYNYSYPVPGSGATEGQWETRVNATKGSTSYYSNQFWKLVGGVFDVRSIVINDNTVPSLSISVTLENTGGADKDMFLSWNLTKESDQVYLISGLDTVRVNAYSNKTHTITPSTDYIGQVRITFIGEYSAGEKAGAYKVFSTTSGNETPAPTTPSGGGGGGGAKAVIKNETKKADLNIITDTIIYLTKNIEKIINVKIKNTGETTLTNLSLFLENLDSTIYSISPNIINSLKPKESASFDIKFLVKDLSGEYDFNYFINCSEINKIIPAKLVVLSMGDYFLKVLENLNLRIKEIKDATNKEDILSSLAECEKITASLESNIKNENFIQAEDDSKEADKCIEDIEKEIKESPVWRITQLSENLKWIITWVLIILLIAVLLITVYIIYKKISIVSFLKNQQKMPKNKENLKDEYFNKKIKDIEEKLNIKADTKEKTEV